MGISAEKTYHRCGVVELDKTTLPSIRDSALFLPKLFLYSDGHNLRTEWHADLPGSMPNMPGEFISDGVEQLDPQATEVSLGQFVNHTLGRVEDVPDDRVNQVAAQWSVIQNADVEEREFCILAGRMGMDPYNQDEMSEDLVRFFEEMLTYAPKTHSSAI